MNTKENKEKDPDSFLSKICKIGLHPKYFKNRIFLLILRYRIVFQLFTKYIYKYVYIKTRKNIFIISKKSQKHCFIILQYIKKGHVLLLLTYKTDIFITRKIQIMKENANVHHCECLQFTWKILHQKETTTVRRYCKQLNSFCTN